MKYILILTTFIFASCVSQQNTSLTCKPSDIAENQFQAGSNYFNQTNMPSAEKCFRMAANQDLIPAYYMLGLVLEETKKPDEAIVWYSRYVETKISGYGFVALKLSKIYQSKNDIANYQKWHQVCVSSDYASCGN